MKTWQSIALPYLAAVTVAGAFTPAATMGQEPFDLDVVTSLTGGAAFIGQAEKTNLQAAEKIVNAGGGINGRPLHFVFHDDQTSPQVAVQITTEIVAKPTSIILGALLLGQCRAMAPLVQKSGPVMYCLSPALEPKPGEYAFASFLPTNGIAETVLRYFHARGFRRLGAIYTTDASGQDSEKAWNAQLKRPEFADASVVDTEHFNPTDVSIAAQLERLRAAKPDALIAYTTGAAVGTIFRGLAQGGFDVPVATSTGNLIYPVMKQFAGSLPKQLYFAGGAGSAQGTALKLEPGTLEQKKAVDAALVEAGIKPDFATEDAWDPAMIAVDALRHVGPDASPAAVQSYILGLKHYVGLSGTYDFQKYPASGLGAENAVVVRWSAENETFEAVSQPGGEPIAR